MSDENLLASPSLRRTNKVSASYSKENIGNTGNTQTETNAKHILILIWILYEKTNEIEYDRKFANRILFANWTLLCLCLITVALQRVFVKLITGKHHHSHPSSTPSKVLAVHQDSTFDSLLQKIGQKFDIQVTEVSFIVMAHIRFNLYLRLQQFVATIKITIWTCWLYWRFNGFDVAPSADGTTSKPLNLHNSLSYASLW
jgi:hypothetical protein